METKGVQRSLQGATLVDLLDRILDKGLVVAGDIVIQLADVELLTIKIRLLVCSVDKAQEIGMDWWRHDTFLTSTATPKLFEKKKRKPESSIQTKTLGKVMRERKISAKGGSASGGKTSKGQKK
jgi:hypothetical protein